MTDRVTRATLRAKIFAVVVALELAIGVPAVILLTYFYRQYEVTMTEVVNAPLARSVATELIATDDNGDTLAARAKRLFSRLMAVNPTVEIYLLNGEGRLLAATADESDIARRRVDLGPITNFVRNEFTFPIFGDDPKHRADRKIFSAAALPSASGNAGYIYVILGGADVDATTRRLQTGFLAQAIVLLLVAGILAGLLSMLYIHSDVTRRLGRIGRDMDAFRGGAPPSVGVDLQRAVGGRDEIASLAKTFGDMASEIDMLIRTLEKTDRDRRDFIATVSHDLQVPITSVKAHIETLLMKDADIGTAQRTNYLTIALSQVERLNTLTEELFELAKLESPGFPLTMELFAITDLVQDVAQKVSLPAKGAGVTVVTRAPVAALVVDGNIALLERVLDNLLENAIRHTPAGGTIKLGAAERAHTAVVTVSDTGRGIAAEHLPHLFERFYRVKPASAEDQGAGLGLAIAMRIVEMHKGSLTVSSDTDVGTTFEVRLPLAVAPSASARLN